MPAEMAASTTPRKPASALQARVVPDTIWKTDETALWFLAVDPNGEHDTGDAVRWTNKLTLTHQPRVLPNGKRQVELTVKPRGEIRWNTTGANPREGQVYAGPIELDGTSEVTIYAYAEDQGVVTTRSFRIPPADQKGPSIDKTKPAKLRKRLDFRGNADSFGAVNNAKSMGVKLSGGVSLTVGEGAQTVSTRFGTDATIRADDIETFITVARQALGNDTSDVVLVVHGLDFASGHDLETFLTKLGIEIGPGEVEQ